MWNKPITSTTETSPRNGKRTEKIAYFAASMLSPMVRLLKKVSRLSGKKLSLRRNSSSDDDVVMPVVAPERSPKT